ncbi:MAG TPA: VCBS repeat-containing protein, partial [Terriglobia bacterium]|nr:VCBS repeat-containing protein [Terriglobia bacterium]
MPARIGPSRRGIAFAVALGLSALLSAKASAQAYVFGRADFPLSNTPNAVLTADFNGDGRLDLAVVINAQLCPSNCAPASVAIRLGQPDGTFGPETDFPAGNNPSTLVSGDFNRDGKLDLAVLNLGDSTISILLGNGDGTFQPQVTYSTGGEFGGIAVQDALAAADFKGDGKLDLAVVNTGASTISILLGNGDGTFAPHFDYPAPDAASLAVGDFTGDGKLDIAFTGFFNNGTTLSILAGNGDGTFQNPVSFDIGVVAHGLAAADLNHDGKLDLVVSGGVGILVLLGNGNGTFQPPASYATQESVSAFVIADVNGDGNPDVVVGGSGLGVLLGNGDGTLQPDAHY